MPIGASAVLRASVAGDGSLAATFRALPESGYVEPGYVEPGYVVSPPLATYDATVSHFVIESFDSPSVAFGYRIVLDGVEVPESHLAGPVQLHEDLDSHLRTADVTLTGVQYSVFLTIATWTKVPIDIYVTNGQAHLGDGAMREELVLSGVVLTPTRQRGGPEPVITLKCADKGALYDRAELCHEVAPFSGLHRGEIARTLAADVGISSTDIPDGEVYKKALFTDATPLFDYLKPFGEPEAWRWQTRADGTLEAYVADLKRPPMEADYVWRSDDVESIDVETPQEPPSRWIARGLSAVFLDEAGLTTEITRVTLEALYAVKVAVQFQEAITGDIENTSIEPEDEKFQIVKVIEDQTLSRGDRVVRTLSREWGWYNPRHAVAVQQTSGQPPPPPVPAFSYIQDDGRYVVWDRERFVQTLERRVDSHYDLAGNLSDTTEDVLRWYTRLRGAFQVQTTETNDPVVGTAIGDDGQSYLPTPGNGIEFFGLAERYVTTYLYDDVSGAVLNEVREEYAWRSPKAAIDAIDNYILGDGTGQVDKDAPFLLVARTEVTNKTSENGHLDRILELVSGLGVRQVVGGTFDWGTFQANDAVEEFLLLEQRSTSYRKIHEDAYEEVVTTSEGAGTSKIIPGRIPIPRYKFSPFTLLLQEPIEFILEDPVAEAWWGFQRRVVEHDHIQTLREAELLLHRLRRREVAFRATVRRPLTVARKGDTVLLVDPRQGLCHRFLVIRKTAELDLASGRATGTYEMESEL